MLIYGNRCGHSRHFTDQVPFRVRDIISSQTVLKGWNPIHRRAEICDDGFLAERKRTPRKVVEEI